MTLVFGYTQVETNIDSYFTFDIKVTQKSLTRPHPEKFLYSNIVSHYFLFFKSRPQELHADIQSQFLPDMLSTMLQTLCSHMENVSLDDVTQSLRACFKVLSKIQMPAAYMDIEAEMQADNAELQSTVDETKKNQVRSLKVNANVIKFYLYFCSLTVPHYVNHTLSRM